MELDPNFAEAYAVMSGVYVIQREPGLAAETIRKAYELRDRVSEWKRLISRTYYLWNGRVGEGSLFLRAVAADVSEGRSAHNGLGISTEAWKPRKSVEESREALRLNPNGTANYQNLGADLVNLNRFDEAEAVYKLSDERNLPYQGRPKSLYLLAFLKGDQARMAQLAASVAGKRTVEDAMLGAQADTEAWYGR